MKDTNKSLIGVDGESSFETAEYYYVNQKVRDFVCLLEKYDLNTLYELNGSETTLLGSQKKTIVTIRKIVHKEVIIFYYILFFYYIFSYSLYILGRLNHDNGTILGINSTTTP